MKVVVTGKQLDAGDALRSHVEQSLQNSVKKYFSQTIEAHVTFSREAHMFRADCSVLVGQGLTLQTQAEAGDIYAAFDNSAEKLEKRLRRYKRRLTNHHKEKNNHGEPLEAASYVLAVEDDAAPEPETLQPLIIAEMSMEIPEATVGEAVMRMDLADVSTLMFRNRAHGGLNVVYRRPDGNIGWIDPQSSRSGSKRA
jgi:ribosomal subunit interface protein